MALSSLATVIVQYAEDGGPLTASPTWHTVTSYSLNAGIARGKSGWLSTFQAGAASIRLKSFDREFDPDYASRLTGFALSRQIRIRATIPPGGTTYELFRGHIEDIEQIYDIARNDTVSITAVDLLAMLGQYELEATAHDSVAKSLAPAAWWNLTDTTKGETFDDLSGNGHPMIGTFERPTQLPAGREWIDTEFTGQYSVGSLGISTANLTVSFGVRGASRLELFDEVVVTTTSPPAGLDFLYIYTLTRIGHLVPVLNLTVGGLTVSDAGATYGSASAVWPSNPFDGNIHHVAIVRAGDNLTCYVDGVAGTTATGAGAGTDAFSTATLTSTSVSNLSLYTSALSGGNISSLSEAVRTNWEGDRSDVRIQRILDLIGVPSARYNLEVGSTSCGPTIEGNALEHLQAIAAGENGRLFCDGAGVIQFHAKTHDPASAVAKIFSDDSTAGDVRLASFSNRQSRRDIINVVTVDSPLGSGESSDSTSQTANGRKQATVTTMLSSAPMATNLAVKLLATAKDAATRPGSWSAQVGASSSNTWAGIVDIGSKVTRQFTPAGTGAQLSKTDVVDLVRHNITPTGWTAEYTSSPHQSTVYGVFDTGVFDTATWSY